MRKHPLFLGLALVALGALAFAGGLAVAEDDAPAAEPTAEKPACESKCEGKACETATPSPMHSILKWIAAQAVPGVECPCPTTAEGEAGWRAWYAAEAPALKPLRDALVADGWNADRLVGFFKQMAAQKACSGCDKCPGESADASGAADASASNGKCCAKKGACDGCSKDADASGAADAKAADGKNCAKKGECNGCNKGADASGAADAKAADGKCCGGCKSGKACAEECPCPNKAAKGAKEEAPAAQK